MLQSGWGVNRKGAKLCAQESLGVRPAALQLPFPPARADFLHANVVLWDLREAAVRTGCLCCWSLVLCPPPSADMSWCLSKSQCYQHVCALSISSQAHPCVRGGVCRSPTAPTSRWKHPFVPHEALHLFHSCAVRALLAWRSTLQSALKSNYEAC